MSTTLSQPVPPCALTRPEQRGRAAGVLVLALFAINWTTWGMSASSMPALEMPVFMVSGLCFVGCVLAGVLAWRRSSVLHSGSDVVRGRAVGARFGLIVALEFAALFVAARFLGTAGLTEGIPAAVCLGVGLHFFPLARLFHVRLYTLTGVAMCAIALAAMILAPLTGATILWTTLPGLGAAVTLYLTCACLVVGRPVPLVNAALLLRAKEQS